MPSETERERLGRIFYEASAAYSMERVPGPPFEGWDELPDLKRGWFCAGADAVAAALLPPGTVAVGRDRAKRLVSAVRSVVVQSSRRHSDNYAAIHNQTIAELEYALANYAAALQPGDIDPLPGEGAAG